MDKNDSKVTKEAPKDATREGILAYKSKAGVIHKVEAFGGVIYFKEWTSTERDKFEGGLIVGKGKAQRVSTENIRAKMFIRSVCDITGKLIFDDSDLNDIGSLPAAEVEKVYAEIQKVNSVSDEDVDELARNSSSDR